MNIYCYYHLGNHRESCNKICRFCKLNANQTSLTNCLTCNAWYCNKCNEKHNLRKDKYKQIHRDKCKKQLTCKLLQGDTIEHPQYIMEKKLKIDYNYYLTHQIEKPVYQIFDLVMKNPQSIISDLVRNMNNIKSKNHTIKDWFKVMGKKPDKEEASKEEVSKEEVSKEEVSKEKVLEILSDNEDENMLADKFEEDIIENLDDINFDDIDIL
jgi:hypothetical protein